jgi:SOS response associated peptidase (SRAP)
VASHGKSDITSAQNLHRPSGGFHGKTSELVFEPQRGVAIRRSREGCRSGERLPRSVWRLFSNAPLNLETEKEAARDFPDSRRHPERRVAGIWENWKEPASGEWNRTFAIITTDANEFVVEIHDRMPVILPPSDSPAG